MFIINLLNTNNVKIVRLAKSYVIYYSDTTEL